MKAEDIKINVYFTGLEDDDYIEDDYPDGYPGNYTSEDPEGRDFYELTLSLIETKLRESLDRMWPLLSGTKIRSISVQIDTYGCLFYGVAGQLPSLDGLDNGHFTLAASPQLLSVYLKEYWEKITLPIFYELMWEHELIHVLDQCNIRERNSFESSDVEIRAARHLLLYRSEGIADLIYNLKGQGTFKSISEARIDFIKEFNRLISLPWSTEDVPLLYKALQSHSPYDHGPFMVLHALNCPGTVLFVPELEQILSKLKKNLIITDDEIYPIVKKALSISNQDFMDALIKPGLDGISFITTDDLLKLLSVSHKVVSTIQ